MKLKLEITLGDDAMQTGNDLAGALRSVATLFEERLPHGVGSGAQGIIRDLNGNTVGSWEMK